MGNNVIFTITTAAYFLLFIFLSTNCSAESIECYGCNSLYDPTCHDPIQKDLVASINCSLQEVPDHLRDYKPTFCRKTVQTVQGKSFIVRGCGYLQDPRYDNRCVRRAGTHDVVVDYCTCFSSFCNSANKKLPFFSNYYYYQHPSSFLINFVLLISFNILLIN